MIYWWNYDNEMFLSFTDNFPCSKNLCCYSNRVSPAFPGMLCTWRVFRTRFTALRRQPYFCLQLNSFLPWELAHPQALRTRKWKSLGGGPLFCVPQSVFPEICHIFLSSKKFPLFFSIVFWFWLYWLLLFIISFLLLAVGWIMLFSRFSRWEVWLLARDFSSFLM